MTFSMLIAGGSSPFLWRAAPGLLLLALLLSGLSVLSFAMRARRIAKQRSAEASIIPMPPPRAAVAMLPTAETVRRASKTTFLLLVGMLAGILWRDHELISNTRMYFGVSVISQQSDRRYLVHIPDYKKNWDWEFCHPLIMPGPLVDIKYEQHGGCKVVNGIGFVSIHQEEHNAAIQNGRDTAAATATAEATRWQHSAAEGWR